MLTYPSPHLVTALQNLQAAGKANSVAFRIGECNSYFSSKNPAGVSNAFAAALWAIDFIFTNAQYGSIGVNFHNTGDTSGDAAIGESDSVLRRCDRFTMDCFSFRRCSGKAAGVCFGLWKVRLLPAAKN
jgi:hypothetical protein